MPHPERITLFELNEFNKELLEQAVTHWDLPNFRRALALREAHAVTDDRYESDFLEPWVQWVSVHTGTPSTQHQIKHLGDVPGLKSKQLWEALSERGITSGVWGAMNASRGESRNCLFFLPDPWTFSEPGYPEELNRLLDLPRYVAKNYLNLSKVKVLTKALKFLSLVLLSPAAGPVLRELPHFLRQMRKFKGAHFVAIAFTDFVMAELFLVYRRRFRPRFSLVFLNSLAHTQHHHWSNRNIRGNEKLELCLRYLDRILGRVMDETKDEGFLLFNGLSQKNTNDEPPWVLYRQKDQEDFLATLGIHPARIEPHMTHDAHLFFADEASCAAARMVLEGARVQEQALFLVESYPDEPKKLFYRIAFTDPLPPTATFRAGGQEFSFRAHFEPIVTRTGKHVPVANLFSNLEQSPERLYNHEVYGLILDELGSANPR